MARATKQKTSAMRLASGRATTDAARPTKGTASLAAAVLALQRSAGNKAVQRMRTDFLFGDDYRQFWREVRQRQQVDELGKAAARDEGLGQTSIDDYREFWGGVRQGQQAGLGQTSGETLGDLDATFYGSQRTELKARAAKAKRAEARKEATKLLRSQMGREYVEGPGVIDTIMDEANKRNYPPETWLDTLPKQIEQLDPAGLDRLGGQLDRVEAILKGTVSDYVKWLQGTTNTALINSKTLQADIAKRYRKTVMLGALRRYYKSDYDKEEQNSYGFSYSLENSPYAVHIHTAGSGTNVTAVSIKSRANELGYALIRAQDIADDLKARIVEDVVRSGRDSPKEIIADINSGRRPDHWP